jgi:hypothetical protein
LISDASAASFFAAAARPGSLRTFNVLESVY